MRWITLLFWNTLHNQSSDQHVFLFVYWKEERLSCTISGFITLGLLLRSGCVPCSFSARRAPGKKATVPINKVLVRLGRVELSPYSTEADALTTRPGGPNTSVPFHD